MLPCLRATWWDCGKCRFPSPPPLRHSDSIGPKKVPEIHLFNKDHRCSANYTLKKTIFINENKIKHLNKIKEEASLPCCLPPGPAHLTPALFLLFRTWHPHFLAKDPASRIAKLSLLYPDCSSLCLFEIKCKETWDGFFLFEIKSNYSHHTYILLLRAIVLGSWKKLVF